MNRTPGWSPPSAAWRVGPSHGHDSGARGTVDQRSAALALLFAGVLVALLASDGLRWLGLALAAAAAAAFLYLTFRRRWTGPLETEPNVSPLLAGTLAAASIALAVVRDPPHQWVWLGFAVTWALITALSATRSPRPSRAAG